MGFPYLHKRLMNDCVNFVSYPLLLGQKTFPLHWNDGHVCLLLQKGSTDIPSDDILLHDVSMSTSLPM